MMSPEIPEPVKKKIWPDLLKWIRIPFEILVILVTVFHIFPHWNVLINNYRDSGIIAVWFLSIITLLTIAVNYVIYHEYRKELSANKIAYDLALSESNQRHLEIIKKFDNLGIEKKARYAQIFEILNKGFRELHVTLRKADQEVSLYKEAFKEFCQMLCDAFEKTTKTSCHVSIKIITGVEGQENPNVSTFVRSSSGSDRSKFDLKETNHSIINNTLYEQVFNNGLDYYFCNNLLELDVFKSTSLVLYGAQSNVITPKDIRIESIEKQWRLPYKSVICSPIRPGIHEDNNVNNIIGFLCVDSNEIDVFTEEFDKHIIMGCCDGLYNPFIELRKLINKSHAK